MGHFKLSFKHDVTQPAPTVTPQSERNQNVGKYPQNRLSRFGVEIFLIKRLPPQDLNKLLSKKIYFDLFLNNYLAVLDRDIKGTVFAEVEASVGERVNAIIDLNTTNEHEMGEVNFLREPEVSDILASYGPVQFDCDCATGKRIDFQECESVVDRDVSSNFKKNYHLNSEI